MTTELTMVAGHLVAVDPHIRWDRDDPFQTTRQALSEKYGTPTVTVTGPESPNSPSEYRYQNYVWNDGISVVTLRYLPLMEPFVWHDSVRRGGDIHLTYESLAYVTARRQAADAALNAALVRAAAEAQQRDQAVRNAL